MLLFAASCTKKDSRNQPENTWSYDGKTYTATYSYAQDVYGQAALTFVPDTNLRNNVSIYLYFAPSTVKNVGDPHPKAGEYWVGKQNGNLPMLGIFFQDSEHYYEPDSAQKSKVLVSYEEGKCRIVADQLIVNVFSLRFGSGPVLPARKVVLRMNLKEL